MRAQELRIGNWYDHNGIHRQVFPITITEVWEAQRIWCKPIPLTEEWLLKLGGIKATDSFGGYLFYYPNGNGMRIKNNEWSTQHLTVKVEFVHQLQNLYFSLTGEELIIKAVH
jgi:hypothetical protein